MYEEQKGGGMEDQTVKARVNKKAFIQYYEMALSKHGSQRRIAEAVGVSHTLIGQLLRDPRKRYVNISTAANFERVFGAPKEIVFLPELVPSTSTRNRAHKAAA